MNAPLDNRVIGAVAEDKIEIHQVVCGCHRESCLSLWRASPPEVECAEFEVERMLWVKRWGSEEKAWVKKK